MTTTAPGTALATALYEVLSRIGIPVHAVPPQLSDGGSDAAYPCISIGEVAMGQWDDSGTRGFDFVARVHVWWRGGSKAPGLAIQDEIYSVLHRGSITVDGWKDILLDRQMSDVTRLTDGSFHGVCEYRGLLTEG